MECRYFHKPIEDETTSSLPGNFRARIDQFYPMRPLNQPGDDYPGFLHHPHEHIVTEKIYTRAYDRMMLILEQRS